MTPGIIALLSRATNGENFNDAEQEAIRAALLQWLAGGSLDAAFHLDSGTRGQRSPQRRLLGVLRDARLKDCAAQLGMGSNRLAALGIRKRWERLHSGGQVQDRADELLRPAALLSPPLSAEAIRKILGA